MNLQITNQRLADGLCTPSYCLLLHQLGCTQRTAFVWISNKNEYKPFTYEYDPDNYYSNGDQAISQLAYHTSIPAYSCAELKRVLSCFNYTLSKENNIHQLQVSGRIGNHDINSQVFNENEADAFAAILLALLQKKLLPLQYVNEQIRHNE